MRKMMLSKLEDKVGIDLDGDGKVGKPSGGQPHQGSGSGGLLSHLEEQIGFDINGDGKIGGKPSGGQPQQQQQQNFGGQQQHFGGQGHHGGGSRKALLIGINYTGQQGQLSGCVNDVATMRNFIQRHGYQQGQNMQVLVDDKSWGTQQPTRQNMMQGFNWLVQGARAGDHLFLHYSGHGSRVRDTNGDEADGYDETIIPVDFRQAGQITDDDLFKALVAPLPAGVRLTAVMDCCHSGTVLDLPYVFTANRSNMAAVFQNGKFNPAALPSMVMNVKWDLKDKKKLQSQMLQFGMDVAGQFFGKPSGGGGGGSGGGQQGPLPAAEVIMFSGCDDNQTSADVGNVASFNLPSGAGPGGAGGACTNALVAACSAKQNITFVELLEDMRIILAQKRYTQVPQLSSTKSVNLGGPFQL